MDPQPVTAFRRFVPPFSPGEKLAVVIAIGLAHVYLFACLSIPIIHDASGYFQAGQGIAAHGLFTKFPYSEFRSYGYPLFLAAMLKLSEWFGISFRLAVFETQLGLYLLACVLLRAALREAALPEKMVRVAFRIAAANPIALIFPVFTLSEGLSVPLGVMLLAVAVWLACAAPLELTPRGIAVAALLCGGLQMVRPANLYLLAFLAAVVVLVALRQKVGLVSWAYYFALAIVSVVLAWAPQIYNNITWYRQATIFPTYVSGAKDNQLMGVMRTKYGTLVIDNVDPHIFYDNPFYHGEPLNPSAPFDWYRKHPLRAVGTYALHVFNVLDQDFPIPYVTNLTPWYYPWASLGNLIVLAMSVVGIAGTRFFIRKSGPQARSAFALLGLAVVLHLGIQGPFHAEARFGVSSLVILYIWGAWGAFWFLPALSRRGQALACVAVIALAGGGLALSEWVHNQAPAIVAAKAAPPPKLSPITEIVAGKRFESGPLNAWYFFNGGANDSGAAVLRGVKPPSVYSLMEHPVPLAPSAEYRVEFDARASEPAAGPLRVALFAGARYDHPEQTTVFSAINQRPSHYSAVWNSGPDAPPTAQLRFVSVGPETIEIWNVKFTAVRK